MTADQLQDLMTQLAAYLGGGAVLPLFVAFVNQKHWSAKAKQAVMLASAVVLATITYLAQNRWEVANVSDLGMAVLAVAAMTQAAYKLLWKHGGITDAIESKVTFGIAPAAPVEQPSGEPQDADAVALDVEPANAADAVDDPFPPVADSMPVIAPDTVAPATGAQLAAAVQRAAKANAAGPFFG